MKNNNPTIEERMAQAFLKTEMPKDCPPDVLGVAAIKYATEVLARLGGNGGNDEAAKAIASMQQCPAPNPDIAYDVVGKLAPGELITLKAVTAEARFLWAKAYAEKKMAQIEAWADVAPDIRDAISSEVAALWQDGLVRRNMRALFLKQQDQVVKAMTQNELFRHLLRSTPDIIARYRRILNTKYQEKLQAELTSETWKQVLSQSNASIYPVEK